MNPEIAEKSRALLEAFKNGKLGSTVMPEASNPGFSKNQLDERLSYFTLPTALNYQRNSFKLWEAALQTFKDSETSIVFDIRNVAELSEKELRGLLLKHKLAMQPNKHTQTWRAISSTVLENFGSFKGLVESSENDFLKLREIVQLKLKKGFPYLSGPKIFNYWSFIIQEYGNVKLENSEFIEIAPDTHVIKCSVKLGVITKEEAGKLSREKISEKWRNALEGSGITPIEMHSPLWFWSKGGFEFKI